MPKDYTNIPIDQMRRKDREQDEDFIKEMLHESAYCSVATCVENQPFINMNTFVFNEEDHALYIHTGPEGRFKYNVEQNSKVCFTVSKMGRLLPADIAMEFSVEFESVVVFGEISIVEEPRKAKIELQNLLDKYFPHLKPDDDYRSTTLEELKRTNVYKIKINKWTGKKKKAADEFEGAFEYSARNHLEKDKK